MRKTLLFLGMFLCLMACSQVDNDSSTTPLETNNSYQMTADEAKELLLDFIGDEVKTRSDSNVEIGNSKKKVYSVKTTETDATTRSEVTETEYICIYEFAVKEEESEGFALVIGDKRINSVLAYVPEGNLNDTIHIEALAEFMRSIPGFLEGELNQIGSSALTRKSSFPEDNMPNDRDNKDSTLVFVRGFTESHACYVPTKWGQSYPYNADVPVLCSYGLNAPIGCNAVAIAQVMAYHRQPKTYNWDLLLSSPMVSASDPIERRNEIARLMIDAAENAGTTYICTGSPGRVNGIHKFGYKFDYLEPNRDNTCTDCYDYYRNELISSIKNDKPVLVYGQVHAFVVDGYGFKNYPVTITRKGYKTEVITLQSSYYYHINMGWEGKADGWYLIYNNSHLRKNGYNNYTFEVESDAWARSFCVNVRYEP